MKHTIIFLAIIFVSYSCDDIHTDPPPNDLETMNDPDCSELNEKSLQIVTGIRFSDANGSSLGQVGNPNVTTNSPILVFPNPNNGVISISKQNDVAYDLFIIPSEKDTMCSDLVFDNYTYLYSVDSLYAIDSTTIDFATQNIQLQFQSEFAAGYYKLVFYNENDGIIVENVYYDPNKSGNEMIDFLNGEF